MVNIVIVITTYNRWSYLDSLMQCVTNQVVSGINLFTVVVVDGSTDDTTRLLDQKYPSTHIVVGSGNWWFTKSLNEGIKAAKKFSPDYILILNDDVVIKDNFVQELFETYQNLNEECLLGSITVSIRKPTKIFFSGTKVSKYFPHKWEQYISFLSEINLKDLRGVYPTKELPARGSLIPFNILVELNFFDEDFPQYHSDFDFFLRASKKGYCSYISWESVIYCHILQTSASSSFKKKSGLDWFKNFFNPYSRIHITQNAKILWRHKNKLFFFFLFSRWLMQTLLNQVKPKHISIPDGSKE